MNNYISKKIYRFFESRNILKIKFLIHKLFKEKDIGSINLDFSDKPDRIKIIKENSFNSINLKLIEKVI